MKIVHIEQEQEEEEEEEQKKKEVLETIKDAANRRLKKQSVDSKGTRSTKPSPKSKTVFNPLKKSGPIKTELPKSRFR